uniref:Uncharacterized protein n=1 Tax=Candidatus Kentrum sp. FW TaxID=2126338 RepID=A0A450SNW6_9GAMM|nr:MAG: hypothetical protein BECKFW1821A_GA0114235_105417 [Candidatus Kentron sp. FW]
MLHNETQVSKHSLTRIISVAMEEDSIEGSANKMLIELVSHSGLIQQVAINDYSFSHKSLQEYLAACHFSRADPLLPTSKLTQ